MGDYPQFPDSLSEDELIEHFHLEQTDKQFIAQFRGDTNRHGVAVLLKSVLYLGYFPKNINEVPTEVKSFIASQLNPSEEKSQRYSRSSSTRRNHLAQIRQKTGFRFPNASDKEELEKWLRQTGTSGRI